MAARPAFWLFMAAVALGIAGTHAGCVPCSSCYGASNFCWQTCSSSCWGPSGGWGAPVVYPASVPYYPYAPGGISIGIGARPYGYGYEHHDYNNHPHYPYHANYYGAAPHAAGFGGGFGGVHPYGGGFGGFHHWRRLLSLPLAASTGSRGTTSRKLLLEKKP